MRLPDISHRHLGSPTINVGVIEGGVKVNIVPDRCVIKVDRRILPQEDPEEVVADIEGILEMLRGRVEGLEVDCKVLKVWPPSETDEGEAVVDFIRETLKRLTGRPPLISGKLGATDMWLYNQRGIPTIHVGPGIAVNSHITDEYAELQPIRIAVELYRELMASF
jgi:acetylornithine deacetylase/succinyl-diaminopimelate desuccinylase-like protein